MSRFFSEKYRTLKPYVPGEQPKDQKYLKLNTNESPFPPSAKAVEAANEATKKLMLYSDPECFYLSEKMSSLLGVSKDQIIFTNGSDEILNFAFMAFCDDKHPAAFPDITYGFYPVYAEFNHVNYTEIPLADDFSINVDDYMGIDKTIFIANPNAPTGIALKPSQIERIIKSNPNNIVLVDEAYVDFGAESCIDLVKIYDNLLVTQTFSKSRSMAGARLGFGVGCREIIKDLNTIKYSTNPYNVNSMTMAAGIGALSDEEYTKKNCNEIIKVRAYTEKELLSLGFSMTDSSSNFIFAKHRSVPGDKLYHLLKENGVLVRHFNKPRISDHLRITVGTKEQMQIFIETLKSILEDLK